MPDVGGREAFDRQIGHFSQGWWQFHMSKSVKSLRAIPAVEKVLQALQPIDLPRPVIVAVVRRELAAFRSEKNIPEFNVVLDRINNTLALLRHSRIQTVINGTGIIVHTNL